MTLQEFKAWFEGFTECMQAAPTEEQWKRVKKRVSEINDVPVTYPIYVDWWRPYWINSPGAAWLNCSGTDGHNLTVTSSMMADAGRAEYIADFQ